MKTLTQRINEWKLTSDSLDKVSKKIKPETYSELREIVIDRYELNKKYINLRDVDVSNIKSFGDEYEGRILYSGYGLFYYLRDVEVIDVTDWDTSNVTDFLCLFDSCHNLKEIRGIENWDVSNVIDMSMSFYKCHSLEILDLSNWEIKNVTKLRSTFSRCFKLTKIKGIDNWNVFNVSDKRDIFYDSNKLQKPKWYIN